MYSISLVGGIFFVTIYHHASYNTQRVYKLYKHNKGGICMGFGFGNTGNGSGIIIIIIIILLLFFFFCEDECSTICN